MTAGCCNAEKVELLARLKERLDAERCPDVRRGLIIAMYEVKRNG